MSSPSLTVLVVEGPGTLEATLTSVLRDDTPAQVVVATRSPGTLPAALARAGHRADPRVGEVAVGPDATRAAALNAALEAATGDVVGVLGTGDILEPGVLAACRDLLAARPADVLHTDEQWPGEGASGIFTKPGWNPEYLLGLPYLGRLCLVRRELLVGAGGFREGVPDAEEWDAHLRLTGAGATVAHLPVVGLTRTRPPDHPAEAVATRVVADHLERTGVRATVEPAELPGSVRVWREVAHPPMVSVVIPTIGTAREVGGTTGRLVTRCVRSLAERSTYDRWEVVLVTGEGTPTGTVEEVRDAVGDRLVVTSVDGPFHFSRSINEGARVASGDALLLLNDDTELIEPRALERMVGVLTDPTIGAVGAKLLFEDGRVQHLGIAVNDAWEPDHPFIYTPDDGAHFGMGVLDMDWIAVTGACLLTPRDLFVELGGFTPELPLNYNDVDYCLKVRHHGLRVVGTPFARWHHYESSSRTPHLEEFEREYMRRTWSAALYRDPYTNVRSVR